MMQRSRLFQRRSTPVLLMLGAGMALLLAEIACSGLCFADRLHARQRTAQLVAQLGLSDIALFTEARYTRHPSQADLFTPFQDAPGSLEHFPSGSLLTPPPHIVPTTGRARQSPPSPSSNQPDNRE